MNFQKDKYDTKYFNASSKDERSDDSIYSTCSNSHESWSSSSSRNDLITSVQSVILAGQSTANAKVSDITLGDSFFHNEANFSISPLELNVLSEDSNVYMDCLEDSKSDTNKNDRKSDSYKGNSKLSLNMDDSTSYVPYERMLKDYKINDYKCNNEIDQNKHETEKEKDQNLLITIVGESEMACRTSSLINNNLSSTSFNNTGKFLQDFVDEKYGRNKVFPKKVLFADRSNFADNVEKNKSKYLQKTPKPLAGRNQFCTVEEKCIDENSNNHNTTESFVIWEKFCKASERLGSRRSCSFSELNTTENYDGDNEFSVTYKSLDETYLSGCSVHLVSEKNSLKRRSVSRSKSCDNLLREVKHLPHVLYDKFLKCLATEIENMRKQKVYCTCFNEVKKQRNKENFVNSTKTNIRNPTLRVTNIENKKKNKQLLHPTTSKTRLSPSNYQSLTRSKLSPETAKGVSHQNSRLSPDFKNSSHFNSTQRLNTKSPSKTPTTPTRKLKLCWQKEIISPVGEYIRGKRPSPYQSSPSKRVV